MSEAAGEKRIGQRLRFAGRDRWNGREGEVFSVSKQFRVAAAEVTGTCHRGDSRSTALDAADSER